MYEIQWIVLRNVQGEVVAALRIKFDAQAGVWYDETSGGAYEDLKGVETVNSLAELVQQEG